MPERSHRRPARIDRPPLPTTPQSAGDAAATGWTSSAQRHAVRNGDLLRPRRGVVAAPAPSVRDLPGWARARRQHLDAARAAAVSSPRAVISHAAAAIALDLPVLRVPGRPCLTVPAGTRLRDLAHAHLHRAALSADDVVDAGGLTSTSPARTVMDVSRELGVAAGVVAGDAALHTGLVDATSLAAAFDQCRGWPGRKRARAVIAMCDGHAESPLESLSRLQMRIAGLPTPESQVDITDSSGRFLGRADFYWDAYGVVGEADGDLKYADRDAVVRERRRQQLFEQTGLLVVRWGMRDLSAFEAVARQLREASARGARPGSPLRRWRASLHPPQSPTRLDELS